MLKFCISKRAKVEPETPDMRQKVENWLFSESSSPSSNSEDKLKLNSSNSQLNSKYSITLQEPDENANIIIVSELSPAKIIETIPLIPASPKESSESTKDLNVEDKKLEGPEDEIGDLFSNIMYEAADGILVSNTISNILDCIDDLVHNVQIAANCDQIEDMTESFVKLGPPLQPPDIFDVERKIAQKIFSFLPIPDKRNIRLVSRRWKNFIEESLLSFQLNLTQLTLSTLKNLNETTPLHKLIAFNLLDVDKEDLTKLNCFENLKHLKIESLRNDSSSTIGELNLIELLKLSNNLQYLNFNPGSLANFGLQSLNGNLTPDCHQIGWEWPQIKVQDKVTAVSSFFQNILGDLDGVLNDDINDDLPPGEMIPSDPPVRDTKYQETNPPPWSTLTSLTSVQLDQLRQLSVTVQPTQYKEKMGLLTLLHVLTFPSLRILSISVQEYIPDEPLYRSIFKFIVKHKSTLRDLTFINPVLSTKINTSNMLFHMKGLEKVKLRKITVAWDVPMGMDVYWSNGHYLLECQRRLEELELHSTNVVKVESIICNNFRSLTSVYIDIADTTATEFDCSCFSLCSKLKKLTLRVAITVKMKNVSKIPDTLDILHWDAMFGRDDVRWMSRFLILATSIYLYHAKHVPMDLFVPFSLQDFLHFIRLSKLQQLYLPRIQIRDPRVTQFCQKYTESGGLVQDKDLFFIDRNIFNYNHQETF